MKNEKLKACCRNIMKNLITWIIALKKSEKRHELISINAQLPRVH
jgi:hypothetical protein